MMILSQYHIFELDTINIYSVYQIVKKDFIRFWKQKHQMEEEESIIIGSKEEKRNGHWEKSWMHQIGQEKV